jgi:hypothetical protein
MSGEADVSQDFRQGWRLVPARGLHPHLVTWLARMELEATGCGLVPSPLELHDGSGLSEDRLRESRRLGKARERILERHRPTAYRLLLVRSGTCGDVADHLAEAGRKDLAREVELWAVASLKPNHVAAGDSEAERLFPWD